jgi:hypothetical protein
MVACLPADSITANDIDDIRSAIHSADPVDSAFMRNGHLPYVPDTAVVVVSDSTTCAAALAAHNSAAGYTSTELASPAAQNLYVLRVGNVYVTSNTAFKSGEFVNHIIWDSGFHHLADLLM